MSQLSKAYKEFFTSQSGTQLLETISNMIESLHEDSEKNPEKASDNAQKAAGIRQVENTIKSTMTGRGGSKRKS